MDNRKHYLAAISAFVIWGFFAIPLRALKAYSPGEILYFRILVSLIVMVIVLGFKKSAITRDLSRFRSLTTRQRVTVLFLTLAGGALLSVNWLTFIYTVNHINVKTASFAYLICPVITAVLGVVLLREKMSALQWIAVFLCTVSCILMGFSSLLEMGYSFLTAFTYALYLITQRKNQGFDRMVVLGIQVLFSFILLSLFVNQLVNEVPADTRFYGIILIIAVLFTVFPLFLNLFALNRINSATIGILMYLNPLFNFSIAFIVFHESVTSVQIAGYAIIAVALVVFNYRNFGKIRERVQ